MIRHRLLPYIRPYWRELLLVLLAMAVTSGTALLLPLASQRMVDALVQGRDRRYFTILLLQMLAMGALMMLTNLWRAAATERAGQRALVQLRTQLFERVLALNAGQLTRHGVGQNRSRILNDTQVIVSALFGIIPSAMISLLRLIAIAAVMLTTYRNLSLWALTVLPAIAGIVYLGSAKLHRSSAAVREALGWYSAQLEQGLARAKHTQANNMEGWETDRFRKQSQQVAGAQLKLRYLQVGIEALVGGMTLMWPLLMLWLAAGQVRLGLMTVGQLVSFNMYLGNAFGPVQSLGTAALEMQTVRSALDRVEGLVTDPAPVAVTLQVAAKPAGSLRFEDLWFGYAGRDDLLREINLQVQSGQLCALVGASGAGKSTLLDLAVGFHEPVRGRVLLDEVDTRRLGKAAVRQRVALVPQDPPLFSGTLRENLVWGAPETTDDVLMATLRTTGLLPLIRKLPGGLDYSVSEKGTTLSAGERQRIALVRALLRNCPILLLDEPTGNLDVDAETELWQVLVRLKRDRAILVVVHRLVHLHMTDQILVLENGTLRETGSFSDLVAADGTFAAMYRQAVGQ